MWDATNSPQGAVDEVKELLAQRRHAVRPQRVRPLCQRGARRVVRPHQGFGAAGVLMLTVSRRPMRVVSAALHLLVDMGEDGVLDIGNRRSQSEK